MIKGTVHRVFHSMGIAVHCTLVEVTTKDADERVALAEKIFSSYDERFSRFKETSELHRINTSNGTPQRVSIDMFRVLKKCVTLAEETGGAFDPSVGGLLASFGYGLPANPTLPDLLPTYRDIVFNDHTLEVTLAPGQILEPASVVKSMAIDEAAKAFRDLQGFMLNAGGDIFTQGTFEDGESWNVAVQDPREQHAIIAAMEIRNAGIATSGVYQTRGEHKGKSWHHLIDMRTRESTSGIISATVIAPTCEQADTEATLAILLGVNDGLLRLEQKGFPYFLLLDNGTVRKNTSFISLEVPLESLANHN